jgi:hypothetical protein
METLGVVGFGINSIIQVYPKLTNETYKKINMRFIKEIIRDLEKEIQKI